MAEKVVTYESRAIRVLFLPERCTHVSKCLSGLPSVFSLARKPWVRPQGAPADVVAKIILKCPTGALKFERLDGGREEEPPNRNTVAIESRGPYNVHGDIHWMKDGCLQVETRLALCRCGKSRNFPLCDGAHEREGFIDSDVNLAPSALEDESADGVIVIQAHPDGPIVCQGPLTLVSPQRVKHQTGRATLCGCGLSRNKPFCDGSHAKSSNNDK